MDSRLSGGRRPVHSCVAGKRPLSLSWSESSLKYLLDFFFFPNQRSIAVPMDLADSFCFVEWEALLAVAPHIQPWFL